MRRRWIVAVAGLALLLVAAGVAGFFLTFERSETPVQSGPGPLARRDPHLALARLLAAMGSEVATAREPSPPTSTTTPFLLLAPPGTVGDEEIGALEEWVSRGGLLVATPQPKLLTDLQVTEAEEGAAGIVEAADPVEARPSRRFRVWMPAAPRLEPIEGSGFVLAPGTVLVCSVGEGTIVLLAADRFARNDRIGALDHAAFLWALLSLHGEPDAVTMVAFDTPPQLPALLARHAWAPALALLALLAAWAWRAASRIGPVLQAAPPPRRSLLEHVRASGDLLWRHREVAALLRGPREAVTRRAAQRHPGWRTLPLRQRIQRLADVAGVSGGLLAQALDGPAPQDDQGFRRTVELLSKVWRSM